MHATSGQLATEPEQTRPRQAQNARNAVRVPVSYRAILRRRAFRPNYVIGLISFIAIFGGALVGVFAARALPEHHLSSETRTAVTVSVAIVGTLSALVLGLMISTASSSFSARSNEVTEISSYLIRMDRILQRYGPEAQNARAKLRTYIAAKSQELFPVAGQPPQTNEPKSGSW